jgi:hypothetical protein
MVLTIFADLPTPLVADACIRCESGQTAFDDYLTRRATDRSYTFRQHLRQIAGPSRSRR